MSTNNKNNGGIMDAFAEDMKNPLFKLNIGLMKIAFWGGIIVFGGLGLLINLIS